MRHTVRLKGVIVGHSELENIDESLGRAWGMFRPGMGYDLVQPIFRLFAEAVPLDGSARNAGVLQRYYNARDALELELQDQHGRSIRTSGIHIADYREEEGETAIELDVLIKDQAYWATRTS